MDLLEKYLKLDEAKPKDLVAKDLLTILQALWKAEALCNSLKAEGSLDPKAWLEPIKKAIRIIDKIIK